MRRAVALLALLACTAVAVAADADPAAAQSRERVIVVAMPGLTWSEVREHRLPTLESFLDGAAVAGLAPRSVRHSSRPGDAYLTIGGGTRAIGDPLVDGAVLPTGADYFGEPAGGVFERRSGEEAGDGIVALNWPALVRANDREPYDVVLGLLADTLHDEDIDTAVIGNADGSDLSAVSYERQAALALTGTDGRLDAGAVGADLVDDDPSRPFGARMDADGALAMLDDVLHPEDAAVVLIEASDLARAMRYRPFVDAARYAEVRGETLQTADDLLAGILERTDPERDTVMVLGPYHQPGRVGLTVAAVRGPDTPPGYLQSASTQRAGIVTLVDVAPSILDVFGIARPTDMEGRPFEIERSSSSLDHRVDRLVAINDASRFRERLLTPTTIAAVMLLALVVAGAILAIVIGWSARARRAIATAALVDLSILPASYVARGFPLEDLGAAFYWSFLAAASLALGVGASAMARRWRRPSAALIAILAVDALVLAGDVMTGSNLHLSAAFGYSPTGNSRLYGISNYSFGQLSAATLLLAAFIAHRWPTTRGRGAAIGLLVGTLVVLGVPIWGSDVGGIIAFTPTVLVFATVLTGRRPSIRAVLVAGAVTAAAVTAFGFADLARPPDERAHLGRLFERIGDEGLQPLLSIMERKLLANLRVSTSSFWVAAIPIVLVCWLFLRWWRTRPLHAVHARIPSLHAALLAGLVAAVVGSAVNDSGAIVGGVASLVLAASLVHLTLDPDTG